jgi:4-amino-4-deoxy-L-arabinose transferase-like glycosyltransferase
MNGPTANAAIPAWLVWIVALGFVLAGLGSVGILDNNEGLYAGIPREMLASGDWKHWVIPHLNGVPYMEKPPLLYWLTAICFFLFGESEWSARAVPALSALACVAMLLWFGRAVYRPQAGRLAAIMFITGIGVAAMSRVLMFDMLLTALLTAALMCGYRYAAEGKRRFIRWSWGFLALALLAKGFVAVILYALVIGSFLLATRPLRELPRAVLGWLDPAALAIFAAVAVPWHLAASLSEPVFAWFYFINEHVLRFLGQREPHDYYAGPWWYYLPRMVIYLFPWSFLLLCLGGRAYREPDADSVRLQRFLLAAWLAPLVFFSISSAKANYYLVAVMPFAAFQLALLLDERGLLRPPRRAWPGLVIALLAAAGLAAILAGAARIDDNLMVAGLPARAFLAWTLGGLALLGLGGALLTRAAPGLGILGYLPLPVWTAAALWLVLSAMEPVASTRQVARLLEQELPGRHVYLYRDFEQKSSLPFYLKRPVPILEMRSNDLFWGDRLRKGNTVSRTPEQFAAARKNAPVAVVVAERHLKDFRASYRGFKGERRVGDSTVFFD